MEPKVNPSALPPFKYPGPFQATEMFRVGGHISHKKKRKWQRTDAQVFADTLSLTQLLSARFRLLLTEIHL